MQMYIESRFRLKISVFEHKNGLVERMKSYNCDNDTVTLAGG